MTQHQAELEPTDPEIAAPRAWTAGSQGARVLVVSRDGRAERLRASLQQDSWQIRGVRDAHDAPAVAESFRPHVVLVDAGVPEAAGLASRIKDARADATVLLLADGESAIAGGDVATIRAGDLTELRRMIERELTLRATNNDDLADLIGDSPQIEEVRRLIRLTAPSNMPVLILGETGTGKELVARLIHRMSPRHEKPFVSLSCAALGEPLLASELFGNERTADDGAIAKHRGRLQQADGGTLLLDEIGDLPPTLQAKLLRTLEDGVFEHVGSNQSINADVRVIAATHRLLESEVQAGRFRADLFYRLKVLCIPLPALRERRSDIPSLWNHLLKRVIPAGRRALQTDPEAMRVLLAHDWPGNVRELESVARHVVSAATEGRVLPEHLPVYLADAARAGRDEIRLPGMSLKELERIAMLRTYEATGSVKATAEVLDISVRKVHYRLKQYREEGWLAPRGEKLPNGGELGLSRPLDTSEEPRSRRILLAEDDDDVRWALTDLLTAEGYDVVAVPDGTALLEHLGAALLLEQRDAPPELIITDVRMPGLNGIRLLEGVRARGWKIPVILISAFGDDQVRMQARQLGATAFLDKPLDLAALQSLLQNAVATTVKT
jgi:DNA-binding NtrC family response regulator